MKRIAGFALFAAVVSMMFGSAAITSAQEKKPNILVIFGGIRLDRRDLPDRRRDDQIPQADRTQ
jgi:hypothetical protein